MLQTNLQKLFETNTNRFMDALTDSIDADVVFTRVP